MDGLDLEILRRMYAHLEVSREGMDPRISSNEIATGLGVSAATVKARLRKCKEEGFVLGWGYTPAAQLLGIEMRVQRVFLPGNPEIERALDELEDVEGVVAAFGCFYGGQEGVFDYGISLDMVQDHPSAVARRQRLLHRLLPEGHFEEPIRLEETRCSLEHPSPLDWRIIQALMERPELPLRAMAKRLSVSRKTVARHYNRLLDTHALVYGTEYDFSKFPGITVAIVCDGPKTYDEVSRYLESRFRHYLPFDRWNLFPGLDYGDPNVRCATLPVRNPADADLITGELRGRPGVVRVLRAQFTTERAYPQWFRQRIDELVAVTFAQPHDRGSARAGMWEHPRAGRTRPMNAAMAGKAG